MEVTYMLKQKIEKALKGVKCLKVILLLVPLAMLSGCTGYVGTGTYAYEPYYYDPYPYYYSVPEHHFYIGPGYGGGHHHGDGHHSH